MNWENIYLCLMHREMGFGYKPWEIRRLTIPEVVLALEDMSKPRPAGGAKSPAEVREYAKWFRGLSAQERIALAREE